MAEFETVVQRFEFDASQYLNALEQTQRGLTGLQPVATETEQRLTRGYQRSAASAAIASNRIVASSGRMRFALQNAAFQVADIAQQLEAGVPALRVFAVQGAQVAGAFGPWGAILGAAIGVTGALAGSLLGVSRNSLDAADDIETLTDRIEVLATKATDVEKLIEKFDELSEGMRRIGEAELEVRTLPDLETDLTSARVAFDGLLESVLESTRIVERAQFDEMAASIVDLLNAMRQGEIDFDQFIRRLGEFRDIPGPTGRNVRSLTDDLFEQARAVQDLTDQYEAARIAQQQLAADLSAFGGLGVPSATLEIQAAIRQRDRELRDRRERRESELTPQQRRLQQAGAFLPTTAGADAERAAAAEENFMRLIERTTEAVKRAVEAQKDLNDARAGITGQAARTQQQIDFALQNQLRGQLNLPSSQQGRVEAEMLRLRQEGLGEREIASLAPQIEDAERLNTQLMLMTETAPALANQFAELGTIALFEGPEEAGQAFIQTLVQIALQMVALTAATWALNAAMLVLNVLTGGAPAAGGATGPGGAGFSLPIFGGPRQHGGRVRPGSAFLVGEAGPELFAPDTSGMIIPNNRIGGGSVVNNGGMTANITIDARGAQRGVGDDIVRAMKSDPALRRMIGNVAFREAGENPYLRRRGVRKG